MQTVDMWLATNSKYFAPENMPLIKQKLEGLPEEKVALLYSLNLKDPTIILIVSLFAGGLGIDRFMLGDTGMGVGKLLTAGGCGVWAIVDWFLVMGRARELNFQAVMQTIGMHS